MGKNVAIKSECVCVCVCVVCVEQMCETLE